MISQQQIEHFRIGQRDYISAEQIDRRQVSLRRCVSTILTSTLVLPGKVIATQTVMHDKAKRGCLLCSESDPIVLVHHHVDPRSKRSSVSGMCGKYLLSDIHTEMARCLVLCRNCHIRVHAMDKQLAYTRGLIVPNLYTSGQRRGSGNKTIQKDKRDDWDVY